MIVPALLGAAAALVLVAFIIFLLRAAKEDRLQAEIWDGLEKLEDYANNARR